MRPYTSIRPPGDWEDSAACRAADAEVFFSPGARPEQAAKAVCSACPVRWECLAYALRYRVEHGIWGGLTERDRRRLLNRSRAITWDPDAAMRSVG